MAKVKICGITNTLDAQRVCDSGADALGLVFYKPSPRCVKIEVAKLIIEDLPPFMTSVALFVNAGREEIEMVLREVDIDIIQFHGDETADFCDSFSRPYIKAIRMKDDVDLHAVEKEYTTARALLLDTYKKEIPGGTGESFNWDKVSANLDKPVILAGGLTADNVTQAIQQVRPYAVDVSGGVEVSKGKKDQHKIIAFMNSVKL